jgi:hypothetical protein
VPCSHCLAEEAKDFAALYGERKPVEREGAVVPFAERSVSIAWAESRINRWYAEGGAGGPDGTLTVTLAMAGVERGVWSHTLTRGRYRV